MFATLARYSKASRLPLTSKKANKDFYKGFGAAFEPGSPRRTGAVGKHVIGGKAKFRIVDERVRYYVAPDIETIISSPLKPYVHKGVRLTKAEMKQVFHGSKLLTGERLMELTKPPQMRTSVLKGAPPSS